MRKWLKARHRASQAPHRVPLGTLVTYRDMDTGKIVVREIPPPPRSVPPASGKGRR